MGSFAMAFVFVRFFLLENLEGGTNELNDFMQIPSHKTNRRPNALNFPFRKVIDRWSFDLNKFKFQNKPWI